MVISGHATGEDELCGLTIAEGPALNSALGDRGCLIGFDHLASCNLQVGCILGIVISTTLGKTKARGFVDITNGGNAHIDVFSTVRTGLTSVGLRIRSTFSRPNGHD